MKRLSKKQILMLHSQLQGHRHLSCTHSSDFLAKVRRLCTRLMPVFLQSRKDSFFTCRLPSMGGCTYWGQIGRKKRKGWNNDLGKFKKICNGKI